MQTNERGSRRGRFGKIGLAILGAIIFAANSAWAVPFTGAAKTLSTTITILGSDGALSYPVSLTSTGHTTINGAFECTGSNPDTTVVTEPTGACGAEEVEFALATNYFCQFEGTEGILNAIGTGTACVPLSCYDENFVPQVDCPFTSTEDVTATGGTGAFVGSKDERLEVGPHRGLAAMFRWR